MRHGLQKCTLEPIEGGASSDFNARCIFTNDPCVGQGNRNGTCYTTAECASKGGLSSGTCAQGYGVCCS
eukprot:TCALIF_13269-PA protein Name:"Protein of unknown function" AED:0.59 eAED:0.59 QI:0/0/0/0.33/0/0.33/3/0/68